MTLITETRVFVVGALFQDKVQIPWRLSDSTLIFLTDLRISDNKQKLERLVTLFLADVPKLPNNAKYF